MSKVETSPPCSKILSRNSFVHRTSYLVRVLTPVRQDVPVDFVALINDTTGTLIASSYVDPTTRAGIIFGTGCNAAYMEKISDIPKLKNSGLDPNGEVRLRSSFFDMMLIVSCRWLSTVNGA